MNIPNCHQVRTLLMAYLDSELDATSTLSMSEHFSNCGECRSRLEAERTIEAGLVAPLRDEAMPLATWARLEGALAEAAGVSGASATQGGTEQRITRGADWFGRLSWAAAAALIVVSVTLIFDQGEVRETGGFDLVTHEVVESWYRASEGSLTPDVQAWATLDERLAQHHLEDLALPQDGIAMGHHPLQLLDSREVVIDGVRGVNAIYDCCGAVTTVVAFPASGLSDEAKARLPNADEVRAFEVDGGLSLRVMLRRGMVIAVASKHGVALADEITY